MTRSNYNPKPFGFDDFQNTYYEQLFGAADNITLSFYNNRVLKASLHRPFGEYNRYDDEAIARVLQAQEMNDGFQNISINGSFREYEWYDDEAIARILHAQEMIDSFQNISINEDNNDEAIARALQEMEDGGTENMFIRENNGFSADAVGTSSSPREAFATPVAPVYQDDFLPDNTDYEEITRLEESIGNVSTGLSEREISRLPSRKFKKSLWNRRGSSADENNECVICKLEYDGGDRLITLPCGHKYHDHCIKTWLRDNKNCCICRKEVVV